MIGGTNPQRDAARKILQAAIAAAGAGRLDQAAELLASGGGAALKTPVGQNLLGDILRQQGKFREALRAFDAAVKLAPAMPEAHGNRGVALQEMGRLEEALEALDRALRHRRDYATAHFNRGNVLRALKRFDEAVAAYDRAVRARPAFAEAFLNRGLVRIRLRQPLDALADFGRALELRPTNVAALLGRARAFRDLGDDRQAFGVLDMATTLDPDNNDAALLRASVLTETGRLDEALAAIDTLIARAPENASAHSERATVLRKLQRLDEALVAADTAVRLAPADDEMHVTRAVILAELDRLEDAAAELVVAQHLGADSASFHHTRAITQAALGSLDEAAASFRRAGALDPANGLYGYHASFLHLSLGDFATGWAEHEQRLKVRQYSLPEMQALAPPWQGEDLDGKKLLVYAEQGHGDSIQFARYLNLVAARGGAVTLVVQEALRRLFAANFPGIDVTGSLGMRSGFHYQVSLMSLASVFATRLDTIPNQTPYLRADEERIGKWRQRIGSDGFKVGITWQGNPKYPRDRDRSVRLAEFAPLAAVPGVRLISLQSQVGAGQLKDAPAGMKVEVLGEEIVNNPDGFREVAAAMMNLDLIVMSDTGPAHLAGALGRPVWVALRDRPDWRWMYERSDSPWYPTMRLFRQKKARDWAGVFAEIAAGLGERVAGQIRT